jgi:membrane protease YdiL (CAAX protease family)
MNTQTDSNFGVLLRILRNPFVTIVVLYVGLFYVNFAGLAYMLRFATGPVMPLLTGVMTTANLLLVYCSYAYFVERRPISEFALPHMGREIGIGLLLGFGLMTICVLIAMALGVYRLEGFDSVQNMLPTGVVLALPFYEEMVFRGVVFRIIQKKFGSWVAFVVSSLAFGGVHATNEGETFVGVAAIAFVYGPMLAAPFMLTGRLWMGIGLHGAWNYTMGKVYGISISGTPGNGLFKATFEGPELLTGGSAGMEGSVIAFVLGIAATVLILIMAARSGNIVPSPWKRGINRPRLDT